MSGGSIVERIDAVDALASTLYVRAKRSGLAFSDVASAVRQLHVAFRHLRVEAADQDSLINNGSNSSPVYARQIQPMLEDCDFTLAQLNAVLDKYGDGRPSGDERSRDERLSVVRSKLITHKTNVDLFLDTVQLHNPANRPNQVVDDRQPGLEDIKDKVDQIANKLFKNRDCNSISSDGDSLWLEFKAELEKEGFAPQVLRKHKDILRAYIREMESVGTMSGGTCPTVRGLLEREALSRSTSPKELHAHDNNEKYFIQIKDGRGLPDKSQAKQVISSSPQDTTSDSGDSMALISTNDLIALDKLNSDMEGLSLLPQKYGLSPPSTNQRYHSSHSAGQVPGPELSSSPNSHLLGASPRSMPPLPPYVNGGGPPPYGASPQTFSRLAPDRYGHNIPPDAQWTKIKRTLVSPEVLERAGVRYEARPEFVAVLGRLSREEITEYARQSAEARATRFSRYPPEPRRRERRHRRGRTDSRSSRDDSYDSNTDSSDSSDSENDEKGTKSYPVIVNPPTKNMTSPSSTSLPKPILKNKNENHVRFDPEPHEVSPRDLERERRRDRSSRRSREDSRRYSENNGDRHRDRHGDYYGSSRRHHHSDRRGSRRDDRDRSSKKKAWGETLGAVGIGGAAAGLLSVLAEAASAV